MPNGMTSCDVEKGRNIPKMMDLASTGIRRSARLANKPRQKYGLCAKFSLSVIGACEVAKNPHVLLTRVNLHIQ